MKFDNISWDEYFMSIALLSSLRSKDGNTKVGACIVSDEEIPWAGRKENKPYLETKYPYVCHAELNAILNSNHNLKGSTLYVTLFPCNECTKAVIQAGIKKVVYLSDKYHDTDAEVAARRMLDMAKIPYVHYEGRLPDIKFHE